MRNLYRYTRTYSAARSIFDISSVDMSSLTTDANRRDVFVRAMYRESSGSNNAYLTGTLADADAITGELTTDAAKTDAGVIGYHENFTLDSTSRTLTYTDHSAVAPNMAGLSIGYSGAGDTSDWDAVYGYDAAPEAVILEEIEYLLRQRMSAGQALYGYDSAAVQKAPAGVHILSRSPNIVAAMVEVEDAEASHIQHGLVVGITLTVGMLGTDVGGPAAYQELMRDAGQVRSIIFDEHRRLSGIVDEMKYMTTEGPKQVEGEEEPYLATSVIGRARLFALDADR